MFETFRQDAVMAARSLRRTPGFTAVALLTLALGIGANTAIFSVVNGVLLKPLGYPDPARLMYLTTRFPAFGFSQFWVSPPEYLEFREINRSFAAVGAYTTGEVNLTAGDRPLRARSAAVDEHLLAALALQPVAGRLFGQGETDISAPLPGPGQRPLVPPAVVILSHELWQSAFGGRPMIGQTIDVDGRRREVIGIMPAGADVMDNRTEIWMPLGLNPANRANRGNHSLYLVGRLADGVTPQAAQSELLALLANWGERVGVPGGPGSGTHLFTPPGGDGGHSLQMTPLSEQMLGEVSRSIWVLQAAVVVVLLIACANLANLLLARAETRQREFAVLTALGASRIRLLRAFITESLMLSLAGDISLDPVVLLFAFAVATATGLLFGLAPIAHIRVRGLAAALKDGGAKGASGGARLYLRRALVPLEVALAMIVVIGAGLLVRTVANLTGVDAGFDRSRLVTFSMTLPLATSEPEGRARSYRTLLDRLRREPGVQSATAMTGLPPNRPLNANDTEIDNYTAPPGGPYENVDYYQNVMSDYFETMGIPIVQGRSFQPIDAASTGRVAIVNQTLADTFWKGLNPIGQRLRPCCGDDSPWFTVVGVAKDVKQGGIDQRTGTEFYTFIDQNAGAPFTMNIVMRTTLPVATLLPTIQQAVRDADPGVPVVRLRDMDDVFAESIRRPRLMAQLVGAFAGLALLLAAIGTYGVLAYIMAERRREIGIRMALGADALHVLRQVMTQGLALASLGVLIGVAAAVGFTRLIASLLFGVEPTDPSTIAAVAAALMLVAALACSIPAWRASRLDPNVVLRAD